MQSLYDLGALYSSQAGGIPVLVAFAGHPLYPMDFGTAAERFGPADAVVVPLLPAVRPAGKAAELGPELVGSRGSSQLRPSQLGNGLVGSTTKGVPSTTSSSFPPPRGLTSN